MHFWSILLMRSNLKMVDQSQQKSHFIFFHHKCVQYSILSLKDYTMSDMIYKFVKATGKMRGSVYEKTVNM